MLHPQQHECHGFGIRVAMFWNISALKANSAFIACLDPGLWDHLGRDLPCHPWHHDHHRVLLVLHVHLFRDPLARRQSTACPGANCPAKYSSGYCCHVYLMYPAELDLCSSASFSLTLDVYSCWHRHLHNQTGLNIFKISARRSRKGEVNSGGNKRGQGSTRNPFKNRVLYATCIVFYWLI